MKNIGMNMIMDSRSAHSFIDINMTKKLNLFVYPMKDIRFEIILGYVRKIGSRSNKIKQMWK
jgi:hypothetical protein